jgi:hypothetical protein
MDPQPSPPAGQRRARLAWLALLSGLAVLLNGWPIPLYYGIQLLLGSVPPILALLLWRSWWAVPMTLLASLQTVRLWGHPWAVVIFSLEMLWLTLALRRFGGPPTSDGNGRVVLFALGYWLLVGCPLVILFYGGVMGIDPANVAVTAVKQAFNGLLNTVLAFGALILIQGLRSRRGHGPGIPLRGTIVALALLTITLPSLVIGLVAGHQLEVAVQRGTLDGLQTVNLALSRARDQNTALLMRQLGEAMAYRRIGADGSVLSSDPALFKRLDAEFRDGGRSYVHHRDLAMLVPRNNQPTLRRWVNGYWSYSRLYRDPANGSTVMVQVVEPARPVVTRLQQQSATLLAVSLMVLALAGPASLWLGKRFEREFGRVLPPPAGGRGPDDAPAALGGE